MTTGVARIRQVGAARHAWRAAGEVRLECGLRALTRRTVPALLAALRSIDYAGRRAVRLDLQTVETADTASIAAIALFARFLARRGMRLRLGRVAPALARLLELHHLPVRRCNDLLARAALPPVFPRNPVAPKTALNPGMAASWSTDHASTFIFISFERLGSHRA